jgi:aerobic-type carbon monoxide dehydrogenase small subunit (CoxS/CutS family)
MKVKLNINGVDKDLTIEPGEILLHTLRNNGYYGPKHACSTGDCGACTVIMDGEAVNSCLVFTASAEGKKITTIEGIGTVSNPHPLQQTFVEEGAVQCGYCIPGMILSAKVLLDKNINPSEEEVKTALSGNLCRCTGYVKQIKAVIKAAETMRGGQ